MLSHILIWQLEIISKIYKDFCHTDQPCIAKEGSVLILPHLMSRLFLASLLNTRYFQSWTVLVIHNIFYPCWNCLHKIPLMTVPISTHSFTHSFFFCICEIPFFEWIWKIIPLLVPSPQVDKSHLGKPSLTMTSRSKGLQQKDYLWIREGSLVL